jgi:tetratricopeptide (TPR) repeat protein
MIADTATPSGAGTASAEGAEPYVGPRPFEQKDAPFFFGREREAYELTCRIVANPVVLMYAMSGAGKTSLINARLLPLLAKEGCEVLPVARVHQVVQGVAAKAVANLYVFHTLVSWAPHDDPRQRVGQTLKDFLASRGRPSQPDKEGEGDDTPAPRIAIFDQFEELFTAYPEHWQERKGFFEQLREALKADPSLHVVLSMREDHVAALDPYLRILPDKMRFRFRLERLRRDGALQAVKKPLERLTNVRRAYADGVAERLVDNLLQIQVRCETGAAVAMPGEFVEAVQLQVACQTLWQNLPAGVTDITERELQDFGDVNQSLSRFYERAVQSTVREKGISEGKLRRWFSDTLITPAGTRSLVFRGAFETAGIPNEVVDDLEGVHHLLHGEERAGAHWYELSHDRFIRPIQESNRRWLAGRAGAEEIRQRLEAKAQEWMDRGQPRNLLLDEVGLRLADRWRESADAAELAEPSNTLFAFLQASRTVVEAAQREKERELTFARELAAAQEQRAEAEKRRAEAETLRARQKEEDAARQRKWMWVLAGVTALAVLAALFSVYETARARTAERKASDNEQKAEENFQTARGAADQVLSEVAENLTHVPQLETMREQLLVKSLEIYRKFSEQYASDPAVRFRCARAHDDVGRIHVLRGDRAEAEKHFGAEIAILLELMGQFPSKPDYLCQAADAYRNLGKLLARDGKKVDEGKKHLERTINLLAGQSAGSPERGKVGFTLARAHIDLATLLREVGSHKEAVDEYKEALGIQEGLTKEFPDKPDYQFDRARTCHELGELFRESGDQPNARTMHNQARELLDGLRAKSGTNAYYRRFLALTRHHLGVLSKNEGKFGEAEEHYKDALSLQERLVDEFPSVPYYQRDQALTYQDLGILLKEKENVREVQAAPRQDTGQTAHASTENPGASAPGSTASAALEQAKVIRQKLVNRFPSGREYKQELAHSHSNLGAYFADQGRVDEAEKEHGEALRLREELVRGFPAFPVYRLEKARTLNNLARLLSYDRLDMFLGERGRLDQAEEYYRGAIALREALVEEHPTAPGYRQELIGSLNDFGRLRKDRNQRREAQELYLSAVDHARKLEHMKASFKEELALSCANLGDLLKDGEEFTKAEGYYRQAQDIYRELHRAEPKVPLYTAKLAGSHYLLGMLLQTWGGPGHLEQALAEYEEASRLVPEDGSFHVARHFAHAELGQAAEARAAYLTAAERSNVIRLNGDRRWSQRHTHAPGSLEGWRRVVLDTSDLIRQQDCARLRHGLALAHAALGEWNKAVAGFSRVIELQPDDAEAWSGRARAHAEVGQLAAAVADCQRAIELKKHELNTDDRSLWFLLGTVQERRGKYQEAIEAYSKALAFPRGLPPAGVTALGLAVPPSCTFLTVGELAFVLGKGDWGGVGWAVLAHRGYAYIRVGDHDRAIADYTASLAFHRNDATAYNNRGVCYKNRRAKGGVSKEADYASAIRDLESAVGVNNQFALALANWGEAYRLDANLHEPERERRLEQALEKVNAALQVPGPKLALAYRYRGDICYDKGLYDRAVEDYSEALNLRPRDPIDYARRGSAYAEQGAFLEAEANYAEALEFRPNDAQDWAAVAKLQLRLGNHEAYQRTCEEMLRRFATPANGVTANEVAWACALGPQSIARAEQVVKLAERAVQESRSHAHLNTLGAALYRSGDWDGAVRVLTESMSAHENKVGTRSDWLFLAMAHSRRGEAAIARKWLDKAKESPETGPDKVRGRARSKWREQLAVDLLTSEAESQLAQVNREKADK